MGVMDDRAAGMTARGLVVHRGRTVVSVRVTITDEGNVLMADATVNMFCVGKKEA